MGFEAEINLEIKFFELLYLVLSKSVDISYYPILYLRYDHDVYNRGFSQGIQSSLDTFTSSSGRIRKDLVDQRVVEGHIVPHRLIFTSHAPTAEYQTVAWLPQRDGLKVNISLQVILKDFDFIIFNL